MKTALTLLAALILSVPALAQQPNGSIEPSGISAPRPTLLGRSTRLVVSSTDLIQSMAWWVKLGFQPMKRPMDRPDSALTLSDGQIFITLVNVKQPSPVVMFRTDNIKVTNDTLKALAVDVTSDIKGPSLGEVRVKSPSGIYIAIRPNDMEFEATPSAFANQICGKLTELSIGVTSLTAEQKFWHLMGFVVKRADTKPYSYAIMTDDHFNIGLHESRDIPSLTITYFAKDMRDRIETLTKSGVQITEKLGDGTTTNAMLTSPEGMNVFLFEGEQ